MSISGYGIPNKLDIHVNGCKKEGAFKSFGAKKSYVKVTRAKSRKNNLLRA